MNDCRVSKIMLHVIDVSVKLYNSFMNRDFIITLNSYLDIA